MRRDASTESAALPAGDFERVLAARAAVARRSWSVHFNAMRGAPDDASSLFSETGGIDLAALDWRRLGRRFPGLVEALRSEGIVAAGHSHGGMYFAADPWLYARVPPAHERRRRTDSRLTVLLRSLRWKGERGTLDFDEVIGLVSAFELVRTDLCTVLWHELSLRAAGCGSQAGVVAAMDALEWASRSMLALLPPLGEARNPRDVLDLIPPGSPRVLAEGEDECTLDANAVRAIRASDATFLLWASLSRFRTTAEALERPCFVFGNAFGGIDLPFAIAAMLRGARGAGVCTSVCDIGGMWSPEPSARRARVMWPETDETPRTIVFCDDSITSGRTFDAFRSACESRYPAARIVPFVLTYDLNPIAGAGRDPTARFALADCAIARARWSASTEQPVSGADSAADAVLAKMLASSDEQLRWIATTQAQTIRALNV